MISLPFAIMLRVFERFAKDDLRQSWNRTPRTPFYCVNQPQRSLPKLQYSPKWCCYLMIKTLHIIMAKSSVSAGFTPDIPHRCFAHGPHCGTCSRIPWILLSQKYYLSTPLLVIIPM